MSEEFSLRDQPVEFSIEVETKAGDEAYFANADVRKALSSVPGVVVNSSEDGQEGLEVEVWSEDVPDESDLRNFVLQRVNDSSLRKGGSRNRAFGVDVERVEENDISKSAKNDYNEVDSEDFWSQIRRESARVELEDFSVFSQASELGYESLVNFHIDHKEVGGATDYILDRSIYSWKDIWAALGRDVVLPRTPFDGRDAGILYEIRRAEDGTEYQELWEEILLDYLNDEYEDEVESILESRAEDFETIKEVREQTEDYLSDLDITMPVGYTEKGELNELVFPIPQQKWSPLEVLFDEIKNNLRRYQTGEVLRNDKMAIIKVDAAKDEIYESLKNASERLGSEIDYGFLVNTYNQE